MAQVCEPGPSVPHSSGAFPVGFQQSCDLIPPPCLTTVPSSINFSQFVWPASHMLLPFLAALSQSDVIEVNPDNILEVIGHETPVFLKYFSPHCDSCKAVKEPFEEGASLFSCVTFAEIDCVTYNDVCKGNNISHYPSFELFMPNNLTGIPYRGPKETDCFADFVEHHTLCRSSRPPSKVVELNPLNLDKFTRGCGIALMYASYVDLSQSFAHALRVLADIYEFDQGITMATWNCAKFPEVCASVNVTEFPAVTTCRYGKWEKYLGTHEIDSLIEHVNKVCKTERTRSGLLSDTAGTVKAADRLVPEFLEAEDKPEVIEKVREIRNAEVYVKVMERFLEKGQEQIAKDVKQMREHIDQRKGSIRALDQIKKRWNIFRKFVPVQEEEKPPEQASENAAEGQAL
jgi:protein disulfide-isomerase A6